MKIAILPADTGACGHYRTIWPADAVRAAHPDWEVTVYDPRTVKMESQSGRLVKVHGLDWENLDVLVTQRVGSPTIAQMLLWLQSRGTAVVLDMDDAMWALDPDNSSFKAWNSTAYDRSRVHWSVIDSVAKTADLITVTTSALAARYGKHGRVEILPNRVPEMALDARKGLPLRLAVGVPTVGWSGFMSTHPHDPQVVGSAVADAAKLGTVRPAVMGDAFRVGHVWGTAVDTIPTENLGQGYYRALSGIDIGLVPLALDGSSAKFNRAKSSLKALEFVATGAGVIASPTPANLEFAQEVPIRIANSPAEWEAHIAWLSDNDARTEIVEKQTAALIANGWVLQDRAADWAEAWKRAANRRSKIKGR